MPYLWQVRVNDQWTAMPNNEGVEKDYCDPVKTYRYSLQILKDIVFLYKKCDLKCKSKQKMLFYKNLYLLKIAPRQFLKLYYI